MTRREEPDFSAMTDAELAEWQYAHRDEIDAAWDNGEYEPVEIELAPSLEITRSFRLPVEDAKAIDEAADRAGLSRSEWIRGVLVAAACGETVSSISQVDLERVVDLLRRAERLVEPALYRRAG